MCVPLSVFLQVIAGCMFFKMEMFTTYSCPPHSSGIHASLTDYAFLIIPLQLNFSSKYAAFLKPLEEQLPLHLCSVQQAAASSRNPRATSKFHSE